MARLNGGKLLLDLTYLGEITNEDRYIDLTSEQIKCILSKGLQIKMIFAGLELVYEPIPSYIQNDGITYLPLNDLGEQSEWGIGLNLNDKQFSIVEN